MSSQGAVGGFALRGGTLIDGTGRPPVPNGVVLVQGQQIAAVGSAGSVAIPDGVPVYDVAGSTLLPGLIDGHVHLRSYAGAERADLYLWSAATFIEEQTLHAAANARRALEAGVTTVRECSGGRPEIAVKHATEQHLLDGARVVVAGFVGMTGGHGDLFLPPGAPIRPFPTVDGPDACRALVRSYARDSVDWIKICTSGGVLSLGDESEWRNFTPDETRVIVDEAHALGKRVAAHAHTRAGISQALEAGVDSIEHGSALDQALADRMVRQGTWLCPTLSITEHIAAHGRERGVPEASLAKNETVRGRRLEAMRTAVRTGVKLFVGTDSSGVLAFGKHAWELQLLVELVGVSPLEAIRLGTGAAAEAIGLGDLTGTLVAGRRADLLVVDGDPIGDIRVLQAPDKLTAVFRDGRLLVNRGLR